jgi:hypothetical protein
VTGRADLPARADVARLLGWEVDDRGTRCRRPGSTGWSGIPHFASDPTARDILLREVRDRYSVEDRREFCSEVERLCWDRLGPEVIGTALLYADPETCVRAFWNAFSYRLSK